MQQRTQQQPPFDIGHAEGLVTVETGPEMGQGPQTEGRGVGIADTKANI